MNFSHRAFASHHLTRDSKCASKAAGVSPQIHPVAIAMSKTGWPGSLVLGANQAARLGVISGLQAFAMSRATLLGIQHPVRTPGKGETCLAFAGFQLLSNSRKSRSPHGNEESPVTRSSD
jgi:hypothetical protein